MRGVELARVFRGQGFGVLDVLCLVERQHMPVLRREHIKVLREQRIGGDHEIRLRQLRELRRAVFPLPQDRLKVRREPRRLRRPVRSYRGRRDHQGGVPRIFFTLRREMRECLHGFSQSHVIREDSVESVIREKLEPAETLDLIPAQIRLEFARHLHLGQRCQRP